MLLRCQFAYEGRLRKELIRFRVHLDAFKLGRQVGFKVVGIDRVPFEEKMQMLMVKLSEQFVQMRN
jgi:hypothetical protein